MALMKCGRRPGTKTARVRDILLEQPLLTTKEVMAEYKNRHRSSVGFGIIWNAHQDCDVVRAVAAAEALQNKKAGAPAPTKTANPMFTYEDLQCVSELADRLGGMDKVKKLVDAVSTMTS